MKYIFRDQFTPKRGTKCITAEIIVRIQHVLHAIIAVIHIIA